MEDLAAGGSSYDPAVLRIAKNDFTGNGQLCSTPARPFIPGCKQRANAEIGTTFLLDGDPAGL